MNLIEAGIGLVKEFKDLLYRRFIIIALVIVAGCMSLLHLPEDVVDIFFIDDFRTANSETIGLVAFASSIVAVGGGLFKLAAFGFNTWRNRRYLEKEKREQEELIRNLSFDELSYLFQFFHHQKTVVVFDNTNPAVTSLVTKGLIHPYLTGRTTLTNTPYYKSSHRNGQPFEVTSWVYQYLKEHPEHFRKLPEMDKH